MGQHQHGDAGGQVGVALLVVHTAVGGFAVVGKELFQPCRMVAVGMHVGVVDVLVRVVHPVAMQHAVHQPQRGCQHQCQHHNQHCPAHPDTPQGHVYFTPTASVRR